MIVSLLNNSVMSVIKHHMKTNGVVSGEHSTTLFFTHFTHVNAKTTRVRHNPPAHWI